MSISSPRGWMEFVEVFCFAARMFCFNLILHTLQQSTHPPVHTCSHSSLTSLFHSYLFWVVPGGIWACNFSLYLSSYHCKVSSTCTQWLPVSTSLWKVFCIYIPLPSCVFHRYLKIQSNRDPSFHIVQLSSQLWSINSSISCSSSLGIMDLFI